MKFVSRGQKDRERDSFESLNMSFELLLTAVQPVWERESNQGPTLATGSDGRNPVGAVGLGSLFSSSTEEQTAEAKEAEEAEEEAEEAEKKKRHKIKMTSNRKKDHSTSESIGRRIGISHIT